MGRKSIFIVLDVLIAAAIIIAGYAIYIRFGQTNAHRLQQMQINEHFMRINTQLKQASINNAKAIRTALCTFYPKNPSASTTAAFTKALTSIHQPPC